MGGWNFEVDDEVIDTEAEAGSARRGGKIVSASEDVLTVRFDDGHEEVIGQSAAAGRFEKVVRA